LPSPVAALADATGRDIRYQPTRSSRIFAPPDLDEEILWLMRDLLTQTLDGRSASVSPDLERLVGRAATSRTSSPRRRRPAPVS
jgi:hypothetical protein